MNSFGEGISVSPSVNPPKSGGSTRAPRDFAVPSASAGTSGAAGAAGAERGATPGLHTRAAPIRVQGQQPPSPWADLTLALSFFSARPWADRFWLGISLLPPTGWVSTAILIPPARMRGFGEIQERGQGRADSGLAEIPAKARLRAESVLLCPAESQLRRRPHPHFRARDCVSSRGQRTPQKGPRSGL